MMDDLNQHEILALIEGDLRGPEAADLRRRLGAIPGALETVDLMIRDRASLMCDHAPLLDGDLVVELEPLIARSMLLGNGESARTGASVSMPGSYRARHQRSHSVRRATRFLVAACLLLGLGGASWFLADSLIGGGEFDDGVEIALGNDGGPAVIDNPVAHESAVARTETSAPIHHWSPGAFDVEAILTSQVEPVDAAAPQAMQPLRSGDLAIEAPFVLAVVDSRISHALLVRLQEMTIQMQRAALVRNFTYEEASLAWREMVATSDADDKERLIAMMAAWKGDRMRLSDAQRTAMARVSRTTQAELGEHLAGDRTFAPPAEAQLSFVDSGAAYAMTVPFEHILPLLERIEAEFGDSVVIEPLAGGEDDPRDRRSTSTWDRWRIRGEALDAFDVSDTASRDLMVVLPLRLDLE